jgi:hypothetical protein
LRYLKRCSPTSSAAPAEQNQRFRFECAVTPEQLHARLGLSGDN